MTTRTPEYLEVIDRLNRQSCQLKALLTVATSDNFTSELAPNLRTDYLWACSDLADRIDADLVALDKLGGDK